MEKIYGAEGEHATEDAAAAALDAHQGSQRERSASEVSFPTLNQVKTRPTLCGIEASWVRAQP